MCMFDYDGICTVLSSHFRTANKHHKCSECCRQIAVGEKYLVEGLLFEGEKSTHKTCAHCMKVREYLLRECGGFVYGMIEEDISEHVYDGCDPKIKIMASGMHNGWIKKNGDMWMVP